MSGRAFHSLMISTLNFTVTERGFMPTKHGILKLIMFNILMEFKSFSLIECRGALKDNLYILNVESEESMNNPDIPVCLLRGLT